MRKKKHARARNTTAQSCPALPCPGAARPGVCTNLLSRRQSPLRVVVILALVRGGRSSRGPVLLQVGAFPCMQDRVEPPQRAVVPAPLARGRGGQRGVREAQQVRPGPLRTPRGEALRLAEGRAPLGGDGHPQGRRYGPAQAGVVLPRGADEERGAARALLVRPAEDCGALSTQGVRAPA